MKNIETIISSHLKRIEILEGIQYFDMKSKYQHDLIISLPVEFNTAIVKANHLISIYYKCITRLLLRYNKLNAIN